MNLNSVIVKFLQAVQACSSSPVVQWLMRILALSQAIQPTNWPSNYEVKDGDVFDFVVVGSGSAGGVLATRLTEHPHVRVLLVEAGGDPPLASVIPSLFTTLTGTEYDWDYSMRFDKGVSKTHVNRRVNLIRGKMLGGSSSANYELYARGEPHDYDQWSLTAPGWDWNSVLPYFKKLENMTDPTVTNNPHYSYLHSTEGPVKISRPNYNTYFQIVNDIVLKSYEEMGIERVLEMNGPEVLGATTPHFTFADGRRSSTAESYLKPVKDRPNFHVAKYTRAVKILIDPFDKKAYGIKLLSNSGNLVNVYVNNEVILSAGSIDSPKLLMLSGIGPKEELDKNSIPLIVDLPVGKNLHDHQFVPVITSGKRGLTTVVQNVLSATELDAVPVPTQNAFINLNKENKRQLQLFNLHVGAFASPVIQIVCESLSYSREFCSSIAKVNLFRTLDWTFLILLHPSSRGQVRLKSNNPLDDPIIDSGFLRSDEDIHVLTKGVKFLTRFAKTRYFKNVDATTEKLDVRACQALKLDPDKYWPCFVKNTVGSLQHPVGTCAMGSEGVVDERLRVHGVSGLRVVDASVMPTIPGGNTNAPTMMIGEKAADIMKEDYGLNHEFLIRTFNK